MYRKIKACRICGNKNLVPLIDLGRLYLTGVFPQNSREKIGKGPLRLVKCDEKNGKSCGLVQLEHNYNLDILYGDNYGYRSGLNSSMVKHLQNKVKKICKIVDLKSGDLVIDIGSNDATLLKAYPQGKFQLVGIDPTGEKFRNHYINNIQLIVDFFPSKLLNKTMEKKKAKIITSIAMFYDLEDPMAFVQSIYNALDDNGVWVFEQSYMPSMLATNAYDTICHEHLEYYSLKQIKFMTDQVGFKIIDIEFNFINGGSFSVTVAKKESSHKEDIDKIKHVLMDEKRKGLHTLLPYIKFNKNINKHKKSLLIFLKKAKEEKATIFGYGASTKGNVILQYCGLSKKDIPYIAEVNEYKFGRVTPGTHIPIISEAEAKKMNPHYFMVLPWHFKENIVQRELKYIKNGGRLFFPLPKLEII